MALLQIRTTPLGQGLPSLATLLFNCPVCSIMPVIDRKTVSIDNDDKHHKKVMHMQGKNDPYNDTSTSLCIYLHWVNCSGSMRRHGTVDPWHNSWKGQSQSLQQVIQNTSHHYRENNYTQQTTHQSQHL